MIQKFRNRLKNLEFDLATKFTELLEEQSFYQLNDIKDFDDIDDCFEITNDITGNVIEVFGLYVTNGWIRVVEAEDKTQEHTIKFDDLADIRDRIELLNLMYNELNK